MFGRKFMQIIGRNLAIETIEGVLLQILDFLVLWRNSVDSMLLINGALIIYCF